MNTSFVTVVKDDGILQDIHINDTFFIKDIIVNKTWNDMTMEERTVALHEIHAYSPRFLAKSWKELPKELKDVMLEKTLNRDEGDTMPNRVKPNKPIKTGLEQNPIHTEEARNPKGMIGSKNRRNITQSSVEQGHYGSAGRASHAPETNMDIDATEDYEGQTEDEKKEQFKHEEKKPETTDKSMQEQLWEEWLSKDGGMSGGSPPAATGMQTTGDTFNAVYGKDGRIKGQGKDKEEDKEEEKEEKKG